jgi:D-3-phosphoglycerate dehydrogenase
MKVLITDTVEKVAIEALENAGAEVTYEELGPEDLLKKIDGYDAIMVRSRTKVTKEVIENGKNLKVIGRAGIGVDNIDVTKATERKIAVVNAPRASTLSVAELTFGHMLCLARRYPAADRSMKDGKWEKKKFKGMQLSGKVLGFVGIGRIGYEVAARAKAFGMVDMVAYDPYITQEIVDPVGVRLTTLEEVLETSDFITIHALLTDETRGMINEQRIGTMKDSAFIINCARGGIVDEAALLEALKSGKLGGAALDVYEKEPPGPSELVNLPNVICTPHIAASTMDAQVAAGVTTAEQIMKVLKGEKPDFIVNREILG